MTYSHTVPGEGLQVTNFDQCLHTVMVIGECTDVFWGEGAMREDLSFEKYFMGEEELNEKGAEFSSITIKKQGKTKHEKFFSIESKE